MCVGPIAPVQYIRADCGMECLPWWSRQQKILRLGKPRFVRAVYKGQTEVQSKRKYNELRTADIYECRRCAQGREPASI